jgi:protein TonB
MKRLPLPLAVSTVGHAFGIGALAMLAAVFPTVPLTRPIVPTPVAVVFMPPPEPVVPPAPAPPPPPAPTLPPPPPPPAPVATVAPVPAPVHPPPPRIIARPKPAPVRQEPEPTWQPPPPSVAYQPPPPQVAAVPPPVPAPAPGPVITAGYRAALGAWLEDHKRYPETARARGEQGRATLRFQVERGGRVIGYSLVRSTGYPDLDAAIEEMMRGARLPPFPADMASASIDVSVTVNFSLKR